MSARWVQVLDYLAKFNPEQHEYVAPFCLTQDGIAEAVGISRAHVSREQSSRPDEERSELIAVWC